MSLWLCATHGLFGPGACCAGASRVEGMTPMTDLDYTFSRIHDVASKLAAITKTPELGCATYLQTVDGLMNDLDALRTVQKTPGSAHG